MKLTPGLLAVVESKNGKEVWLDTVEDVEVTESGMSVRLTASDWVPVSQVCATRYAALNPLAQHWFTRSGSSYDGPFPDMGHVILRSEYRSYLRAVAEGDIGDVTETLSFDAWATR